jgi:hypothetical protein
MLSSTFSSGDNSITLDKIIAMLNKEAPKREPKGRSEVESELLVPATIAVITSGAPLASAKKVIPANASEISTASNRCTKFEDKLLETWGHVVLDNNIDSVVD